MTKRAVLVIAAMLLICSAFVSCESAPKEGKYDLSQAAGVLFHYDDFSIYVTDEDVALVEDTLNQFSLCLSTDFDEIAVFFDETKSDEVKSALSERNRVEIFFTSPLAIALMRKNGDDFVLNDYTSIIIPADGDEVYVQKDGVYSSKTIKSVDTSIIKALMEKYRETLEQM